MAQFLDYIVLPASVVFVLGLAAWSYRKHGEVLALKQGSAAYPAVVIAMVVATLAQFAVPMAYKDISQPLFSVALAWAFGVLVVAGLMQRRGEGSPSEPRA